jgi:hypothetical protein
MQEVDENKVLWGLMQALGGGGEALGLGTRSQFLFSHVDLPQVVNEMAVQTLILNQDRYGCLPAHKLIPSDMCMHFPVCACLIACVNC